MPRAVLVAAATQVLTHAIYCTPRPCPGPLLQLTVACRNDLTSSAALGSTYRLIFNACDVSFSG